MRHLQKIITLNKAQVKHLIKPVNLLKFNREISKSQVKKLRDLISQEGFITVPLIADRRWIPAVDDGMNRLVIADGQHRLSAVYQLMKPTDTVQVSVAEATSPRALAKMIAKLNSSSKRWNLLDYANCWASIVTPTQDIYVDWLTLRSRYKMTPSLMLKASDSSESDFKDGKARFDDVAKTNQILHFVAEMRENLVGEVKNSNPLEGVINALKKGLKYSDEQWFVNDITYDNLLELVLSDDLELTPVREAMEREITDLSKLD